MYHKALIFAGRIFREFRESAFIGEINFKRKLFHHHVIGRYIHVIHIFSTQNNAVQKLQEVPSAVPNPNGSLSGRMPSEAISSANRKMSGFIRQDHKKTRGRYAIFSATKSLSSSIASQSLSMR